MTTIVSGIPTPTTKPIEMNVEHNSVKYALKLKINLKNTKDSTATLKTGNKTYEIGNQCISWVGTDKTQPEQIRKLIKLAIPSGLLDINLINTSANTFEMRITLKQAENATSAENQSVQPHPISDTSGILLVQNSKDFKQLCLKSSSLALAGVLEQMADLFTKIDSFKSSDINEILDILEFLQPEDQKRVTKKIIDNCSLKQIAITVKSLQEHKRADYYPFIELLLSGMIEIFASKPMIFQKDLDQLMQVFEDLNPENQGYFINKLFTANQLISNKITENFTEAFKRLQRQGYRLASHRHLDQKNPTPTSSLIGTLTQSDFLRLINDQINSLQNDTLPMDAATVICHLTCINTLMEIAISSNLKPLPKKDCFDPIYTTLRTYREKTWVTRWTKHKECRHPGHEINFLAKFAIQMLKMIRSDESKKFTTARHVFYLIKGLGELAAAANPSQPWQSLKGVIDSLDAFGKAFSLKELKLKAFLRLNCLQNFYLGGNDVGLQHFKDTVKDLIDPAKKEKNKEAFPEHHQCFFVLGLIELLHSMKQTYIDDSEINEKVDALLKLIRNNNSVMSKDNGKELLFRVRPKEPESPAREYIFDKITALSAIESEAKVEDSRNNSSSISSRIFLPAFRQKFPWVDSMSLKLEKLKEDKQIKEDGPYVVELMGIDPVNQNAPLLQLFKTALGTSQNLILITGDPGSGKSLFLKSYLLNILENYQTNHPLPFYISLNFIREPNGKLIQEILERYSLLDYENALKKLPTVWFLDSYDEIFLGNSFKPFNIYETNKLEDWPKAQFVFTCRKNMLGIGDAQFYFAPTGKEVSLLQISPFNDEQIEIFFERYANKKPLETLKTKDDYLTKIEWLGLKDKDVIRTPFYLRKIADYLPTVLNYSKQNENNTEIKSNFNNESHKHFFLDLMLSQIIKDLIDRESSKTKPNPQGIRKPTDYLDFILKVSHLMQISGKRSVSRFSASKKEVTKREGRKYNLGLEKDEGIKEKIKLKDQLKIAKKNLSETDKIDELQGQIHAINTKIKRCDRKIQGIEDKLKVETDLSKYLFDSEFKPLRSSALFKFNKLTEGKEFSHSVLHDYLIEMQKDENRKKRLLRLFGPSEDSKDLDLMLFQIIKDLISESKKTQPNINVLRKPIDYLELILKVSHLMQISGKRYVSKFSALKKEVKKRKDNKFNLSKEKIKLENQLKIAEETPNETDKIEELKGLIHTINTKIEKYKHKIQDIKNKLDAEKDLRKYLFDPEFEYLRSPALFKLNYAQEMEFSHYFLCDHLIEMDTNKDKKKSFLSLFDPAKDSKVLDTKKTPKLI